MSGHPRGALAVSLTALLLSACGPPGPGNGREIAPTAVPYALLSPSSEPDENGAASVEGPVVTTPSVFLLDDQDQLVGVPLTVEAGDVVSVAQQVLDDIEDGPSEEQRETGLSSPLGPGATLDLDAVDGTTARVELDFADRDPVADRLPLVVGQIVLSLSSIQGVEQVLLTEGGEPVEAPLPGGARTTEPVTAADYAALLAAGQTLQQATPSPGP